MKQFNPEQFDLITYVISLRLQQLNDIKKTLATPLARKAVDIEIGKLLELIK